MKSRPILFSAPMVRAILDGTKTQTRRMFPCQSTDISRVTQHKKHSLTWIPWFEAQGKLWRKSWDETCRFGKVGDQLWVRETWQAVKPWNELGYTLCNPADVDAEIHYRATAEKMVPELPWRPSIFMPRFASRITLEITGIRVERLQEISEEDSIYEGIERDCARYRDYLGAEIGWLDPRGSYRTLWESINGPDSWNKNPLVWVISFQNASGDARRDSPTT